MATVTVKSFNEFRGWGFIKGEDGQDYFVLLELDDLKDALDFIIRELKRQEFSELYERAGNGLSEAIVRAIASVDQNEVSVYQVADKIKINKETTTTAVKDLAKKGILAKVNQNTYKLRDPLFKIYLRWVLGLG